MEKPNIQELAAEFKKYDDLVQELEEKLSKATDHRSVCRDALMDAVTRYDLDEN